MYGTGGAGTSAIPAGRIHYEEGLANQLKDAPRPTPQITARLEELDKATQMIHATISDLENRVQVICRPTPPQAEGGATKTEGPSAPLAAGIRELTERVRTADGRLRDLVNRIEL